MTTTKDDRPVIYIDDKDLEEGLRLGLVRYKPGADPDHVFEQWDWKKVFECAGDYHEEDGDGTSIDNQAAVSACIGTEANTDPLLRRDVKRIVAHSDVGQASVSRVVNNKCWSHV
jgi:hypothetical protein